MILPGSATSRTTTRTRYVVVWLLFLATVLNYLDRQVLSVTAPILQKDLGITATGYSNIVTGFLVAYTLGQSLAGAFMDRVGARAGMVAAMAWWSLAGALHAAVRSATELAAFRFLLGIGEAGNWPGAVKTVRDWFPAEERSAAVGLFNSGSAVGAIAAPPLVAWLTLSYSWRFAFAVTGSLGLIWIGLWLALAPAHRREAGNLQARGGAWRSLFRQRNLWGLMVARFGADPVWWFYVFWLPDYLSRARGFSLANIGSTLWIPFVAAGLGNIAGGAASDRLVRTMPTTRARKTVMGASAAVMAAGALVARAESAWLALALISVATFAYSAWASNILTLPADLFAEDKVGSASGFTGTAAGLGGIFATLAIGRTVDRFSYTPVFFAAGLLPLAAFLALHLLVRERDR